MCAAVLALEAITVGLATPVLISIENVGVGLALTLGLGLCVICLVLSGMLRRPWAYTAGWVVQVAAIAMGFLTPIMFVLGIVFAILWAMADLLGRKIDRERAAAYAALDAQLAAESGETGQDVG